MIRPESSDLVTFNQVANRLKIHRTTLHRWIKRGDFPKPVKLNGFHNRYRAAEVDRWVDAKFDAEDQAEDL